MLRLKEVYEDGGLSVVGVAFGNGFMLINSSFGANVKGDEQWIAGLY